jgi:hypothetical protein
VNDTATKLLNIWAFKRFHIHFSLKDHNGFYGDLHPANNGEGVESTGNRAIGRAGTFLDYVSAYIPAHISAYIILKFTHMVGPQVGGDLPASSYDQHEDQEEDHTESEPGQLAAERGIWHEWASAPRLAYIREKGQRGKALPVLWVGPLGPALTDLVVQIGKPLVSVELDTESGGRWAWRADGPNELPWDEAGILQLEGPWNLLAAMKACER